MKKAADVDANPWKERIAWLRSFVIDDDVGKTCRCDVETEDKNPETAGPQICAGQETVPS